MALLAGTGNGEAWIGLELGQVQQQAGLGCRDGASGGEHGPRAGTEPLEQGKVEDGQELYCKFRRANLVEGKVGEEERERGRWQHTIDQGWINGVHVGSGEGAIPHTGRDRSAKHLKYLTFRGSKIASIILSFLNPSTASDLCRCLFPDWGPGLPWSWQCPGLC